MAAAVMAASCMAGGCGKKAASVERISGEERNHDADPAAQEPESLIIFDKSFIFIKGIILFVCINK